MDAADWLWLGITFCAGMFGGTVQNWRLHLRLRALELSQNQLEEILVRETKRRAATDRWDSTKAEKMAADILERSRQRPVDSPQVAQREPWWGKVS